MRVSAKIGTGPATVVRVKGKRKASRIKVGDRLEVVEDTVALMAGRAALPSLWFGVKVWCVEDGFFFLERW